MNLDHFLPAIKVSASHIEIERIAAQNVESLGFRIFDDRTTKYVCLVIDLPTSWALLKLRGTSLGNRERIVVSTLNSHSVYHDCLRRHNVASIYQSFDYASMFRAMAIVSDEEVTSSRASCLTSAELNVVEMLILGQCTNEISGCLNVNPRTVNSHISNIIGKLYYKDRTQLVANIMGNCTDDMCKN